MSKSKTRSQFPRPRKVFCFGSSKGFASGCTSHPQPRKKHISNVNFYKHNIQIRPNYLRRMENPGKPVVIYLLRPLQCLALQSQYPKGKPARKMVSTQIRTLFLIISYKFRFLTSCMACSSMLILLLSGTLSVLFCTEHSNINCVTI